MNINSNKIPEILYYEKEEKLIKKNLNQIEEMLENSG